MAYAIKERDIDVLRDAGVSEDDITHCIRVAEKALEISARIGGSGINDELVGRGGLFHDLGKARTREMEHGRIGAELGREMGLPDEITAIMEKHIRGGLTEPEARDVARLAVDAFRKGRIVSPELVCPVYLRNDVADSRPD